MDQHGLQRQVGQHRPRRATASLVEVAARPVLSIALVLALLLGVFASSVKPSTAEAGPSVTNSSLLFQVSASPNPATAGQQVTWTFTIKNLDTYSDADWSYGTTKYGSVSGLPSGCTLSSPSAATGWTNASNYWYLKPGATGTLTCTTTAPSSSQTINPVLSGMRRGASTISSLTASETLTVITSTTGGSGGTVLSSNSDWEFTKTASSYGLTASGSVTYTYTLKQLGPSGSYRYFLPPTDDKCTNVTVKSRPYSYGAYSGTYDPGDTIVWTCTQQLSDTITNTATVTEYYSRATATAKATVVVASKPDLTVSKTASPATGVKVGDTVTYTVDVTNSGGATSNTWTLTDVVPSQFTNVATTTAGCTVSGNTVTCADQPALAAGATKSIVVTAKAATAGSTSNTATVTSTGESSTTNNSATADISITAVTADLEVTKSASPTTVAPGGTVTYTVTVKNIGNVASSTYTLTDPVPSNFSKVTAPTGCTLSGNTVTCDNQSALAAGASKTFTITAVAGTTAASTTNTVTVTSTGDANAANNKGSVDVNIASAGGAIGTPGSSGGPVTATSNYGSITATKTASTYLLPPGGGDVTYTYTVKNNSSSAYNTDYYRINYPYTYYFRYSMFYSNMSDDTCSPVEDSQGLLYNAASGEYYIPPGGTATFTCTSKVTTNTTNTLTATFYDYYGYKAVAQPTATVNVQAVAGAATCNTLWYAKDSYSNTRSGGVGTVETTGAPGPLTEHAIGDVAGGNTNIGGSAAVAVDPRNPQKVYYVPRDFSYGVYGGLRVYDSATGTDIELASNTLTPDVVRLGFDGTGTLWTIDASGNVHSWTAAGGWVNRGLVTISIPGSALTMASLASGDLVFDGLGNMWFIGSDQATREAYLFTISPTELAGTNGAKATYVGNMGTGWFHGLAFDDKGNLYASADPTTASGTFLYSVDKVKGTTTQIGTKSIGSDIGDLASCALPKPELQVTKTATPDGGVVAGGTITFTIKVENLGNLEATGVTFLDLIPKDSTYIAGSTKLNGVAVPDVNGTSPYVTAKAVKSATAKYDGIVAAKDTATVTFQVKSATNAIKVCNSGTANFTGGTAILTDDPNLPGPDDPTCVEVLKPAIGLDKKSETTIVAADGNPVTYTYRVSTDPNQPKGYPEVLITGKTVGTEPLKNVVVTDDKCSPVVPTYREGSTTINAGDRNGDGILQPNESWSFSCTTDVSLTAETLNTATVTAYGNTSNTPVEDKDTWLVKPSVFSVKKLASDGKDGWAEVGAKVVPVVDPVTGKYVVTATYQVTITNDGIVDAKHPAITDTPAFAPGFTVDTVTVDGQAVALADGKFVIPAGAQDLKVGTAKTYTVVVTASGTPTAQQWTEAGVCETTGNGIAGKGLFNSVSIPGTVDKTDDNDACVPVEALVDITVVKQGINCDTDQATCKLTGANFALYDVDPTTDGAAPIVDGITVDPADGSLFNATGLVIGKDYWLVETQAPKGFNLLAAPIQFSVSTERVITLADPDAQGGIATVDTSANALQLIVRDTTPTPLPAAGGPGTLPFVGVGIAIMIAAGLAYTTTDSSGRRRQPKRAQA